MPGEVDAGLDGDDDAGREDSSAQLAHRGRLVDVEAHAVAGAVLEALGPAGVGDDPAADVVDLLGRDPGRARRRRRRAWDSPTTSKTRASSPVGLGADAEGPGHVRAVAVEGGAEVDHHRVAGVDAPRRRGGGGAWPSSRPAATMVSKARALGPAAAHGRVEGEGELLLGDRPSASMQRQHLERARRRRWPRPAPCGRLAGVLDLAQRLDHAAGGHQRVARRARSAQAALRAQVTLSASRPTAAAAAAERGRTRLALGGHPADDDLDLAGRPAVGHLLGRLGAVAAVGGQQGPVPRYDQDAGRAR